MGVPKPPADLAAKGRGRKFWNDVLGEWDVKRDELELLAEVCRMLDLLDVLRECVDEDGVTVKTKAGTALHPAVVEQRQVRMELRRQLAALGIPDEEPGELPANVSRLRSQRARNAARARWDKDARGA